MTSWREVCETIDKIVRDDVADGTIDRDDEDSWGDYAHEWADGSSWVIYYSESRALWAEGAADEFEADVLDLVDPMADIDQRITAAVYLAVRAQIVDTIREVVSESDDGN